MPRYARSLAGATVICLTPVRNEAWVLEPFLAAAGRWADHIVVGDQGSTDGSREIAASHPKVVLVDNPDPAYDEQRLRAPLLQAARELTGEPRVLIALDADELLAASAFTGSDWERALAARPGTVLRWRWANVLPGGQRVWVPPSRRVFGVVDDGRLFSTPRIHGVRVPVGRRAPCLDFDDSVVLHLQYLDWERMKVKQAWYQCWETLQNPGKRPAALYRQYHHMDAVPTSWIRPVDAAWLDGYRALGIDLTVVRGDTDPWREVQVLDWIAGLGPSRFARLDIWEIDWAGRARALDHPVAASGVPDSRTALDRAVVRWLGLTQRGARGIPIKLLDRTLRLVGW